MSFNLQLSKSENIKAMFSAPKWLPVCIQFRLPIAKWRNIPTASMISTWRRFIQEIYSRIAFSSDEPCCNETWSSATRDCICFSSACMDGIKLLISVFIIWKVVYYIGTAIRANGDLRSKLTNHWGIVLAFFVYIHFVPNLKFGAKVYNFINVRKTALSDCLQIFFAFHFMWILKRLQR